MTESPFVIEWEGDLFEVLSRHDEPCYVIKTKGGRIFAVSIAKTKIPPIEEQLEFWRQRAIDLESEEKKT